MFCQYFRNKQQFLGLFFLFFCILLLHNVFALPSSTTTKKSSQASVSEKVKAYPSVNCVFVTGDLNLVVLTRSAKLPPIKASQLTSGTTAQAATALQLQVKNNQLIIQAHSPSLQQATKLPTLFIFVPKIRALHYSGNGKLIFPDLILPYLHLSAAGDCTVLLAGEIGRLDVLLSDQAKLDAAGLRTTKLFVKTSQQASAYINQNIAATAYATDQSVIYYVAPDLILAPYQSSAGSVIRIN